MRKRFGRTLDGIIIYCLNILYVIFGSFDNFCHCRDRFDGKSTCGSFSRKHDSGGTVIYLSLIHIFKGQQELKTCLACQTQVEEGMYVATLPFFPLVKQVYDIEKIKPTQQIMMQLLSLIHI